MLDAARQQVARIIEKANADADAVRAAAEAEAEATRQRAHDEAEALLDDARTSAAQTMRDAEAARDDELAEIEARAAVVTAETELERLRDEIAELHRERLTIREQFLSTQVYLQGLVSMIDPSPVNTRALRMSEP